METKARAEGKTPHESTQAAQYHVNRMLIQVNRERARLGSEGERRQ